MCVYVYKIQAGEREEKQTNVTLLCNANERLDWNRAREKKQDDGRVAALTECNKLCALSKVVVLVNRSLLTVRLGNATLHNLLS